MVVAVATATEATEATAPPYAMIRPMIQLTTPP